MTATEIITSFELQVSDITELSDFEELSILNRVYQKVCSDRLWIFLRTPATGTVLSDATGSYITMPADFAFFAENAQYTNNAISYEGNADAKVIFIVANNSYNPYQIVNYADRRQYFNKGGYAYLDYVNSIIRFTKPPISGTYEFDYIKVPATLTVGSSPVIPDRFQDVLVYGMATQNDILQLSPKATSYFAENQSLYNQYITDMAYWNANMLLN